MASPITHVALGVFVWQGARSLLPSVREAGRRAEGWLLAACVGASVFPDFDAGLGLLTGDMGRYHNNLTHSILFGLCVCLVGAAATPFIRGTNFRQRFALATVCYGLHVLVDFFTYGRGVMLLWPFTPHRFRPPFVVFYGFHWSEGLVSIRHIWTVLTEALFLIVFGLLLRYFVRRRNGPAPCGSAG